MPYLRLALCGGESPLVLRVRRGETIFFPEKHTFFLQDAGVFNFATTGVDPPGGIPEPGAEIFPFFSRRIGLIGGEEIPQRRRTGAEHRRHRRGIAEMHDSRGVPAQVEPVQPRNQVPNREGVIACEKLSPAEVRGGCRASRAWEFRV